MFDYGVGVDMPSTLVQWTETVLTNCTCLFLPCSNWIYAACAQTPCASKRALQSKDLPIQKLRYVIKPRAEFTDADAKARRKRMAES